MSFTREQCLQRLRAQVAAGRPILGGGAGVGLSAKCAEAGGADLLIIYNSGRFRMAGRGSLSGMMPYGDANQIVMDMAREVLPVAPNTPVLAGVCGTDPFRLMRNFLRDVQAAGFSGVQNFPTVGLIDGTFRQGLEETGMGFDKEVEMIAAAHELGLLTCPYVFTEDEARVMARAGADVLIPHMGLTTKGSIGAKTARDAGPGRPARPGPARRGQVGQTGRAGAVPRRPHRGAGRRGLRPATDARRGRLLRGVEHRTAAHRDGDHSAGAGVQTDSDPEGMRISRKDAKRPRRQEVSNSFFLLALRLCVFA